MSAIITGRLFWTDFSDLSYVNKNGKVIVIKETTAKIVMLAIGDSTDDYGENSWQSFATIAKKASIQRRSVIRVVHALIEHGYLIVAGITNYGTNNFTVNLEKLGEPPKKRARVGRPKIGDSESKIGDSESKIGDSESPDPSFNPSNPKEEGDVTFGSVYTFYLENFGVPRKYDHELLGDMCDEHTPHWTLEALKECVKHSARNLAYADAILIRWQSDGYGTPYPSKNGNGKHPDNSISVLEELALEYERNGE